MAVSRGSMQTMLNSMLSWTLSTLIKPRTTILWICSCNRTNKMLSKLNRSLSKIFLTRLTRDKLRIITWWISWMAKRMKNQILKISLPRSNQFRTRIKRSSRLSKARRARRRKNLWAWKSSWRPLIRTQSTKLNSNKSLRNSLTLNRPPKNPRTMRIPNSRMQFRPWPFRSLVHFASQSPLVPSWASAARSLSAIASPETRKDALKRPRLTKICNLLSKRLQVIAWVHQPSVSPKSFARAPLSTWSLWPMLTASSWRQETIASCRLPRRMVAIKRRSMELKRMTSLQHCRQGLSTSQSP